MPSSNGIPDVSVVMPVFRTRGNVASSLEKIRAYIEAASHTVELILVDDGSSKNISEELFAFAAPREGVTLVQHEKNMGKGRAIADGVAAATAPIVVFIDSEISYELSAIDQMIARFHADPRLHFIVGSRRHPDSDIQRNFNVLRRCNSWIYNELARFLAGESFTDVQCGIKGFRADVARLLFSDLIISRYAFDAELFLRAKKFNLTFEEIPVVYRNTSRATLSMIPRTARMLVDLRKLYGAYKKTSQ
ncbi:MAG: glycosyltransferase [Candidatus Magasanikbacteria bacterium]|nr:glycosyltransferase [Candidatus Magasanikbacteria bacterium]